MLYGAVFNCPAVFLRAGDLQRRRVCVKLVAVKAWEGCLRMPHRQKDEE